MGKKIDEAAGKRTLHYKSILESNAHKMNESYQSI